MQCRTSSNRLRLLSALLAVHRSAAFGSMLTEDSCCDAPAVMARRRILREADCSEGVGARAC
eukprot:2536965-Amphidinium_carterae.1